MLPGDLGHPLRPEAYGLGDGLGCLQPDRLSLLVDHHLSPGRGRALGPHPVGLQGRLQEGRGSELNRPQGIVCRAPGSFWR